MTSSGGFSLLDWDRGVSIEVPNEGLDLELIVIDSEETQNKKITLPEASPSTTSSSTTRKCSVYNDDPFDDDNEVDISSKRLKPNYKQARLRAILGSKKPMDN